MSDLARQMETMRLPIVLALTLLAAPASAGESKQLRDWFVACDNLRVCMAFGFRDSLNDFRTHLRIVRGADAEAAPQVVSASSSPLTTRRWAVSRPSRCPRWSWMTRPCA